MGVSGGMCWSVWTDRASFPLLRRVIICVETHTILFVFLVRVHWAWYTFTCTRYYTRFDGYMRMILCCSQPDTLLLLCTTARHAERRRLFDFCRSERGFLFSTKRYRVWKHMGLHGLLAGGYWRQRWDWTLSRQKLASWSRPIAL